MSFSLSENGQRFALASILVGLWGLLFRDYLLTGLGVLGLGFLGYRYYVFRDEALSLRNGLVFTPDALDESFTAGVAYEKTLTISFDSGISARIQFPYGELQSSTLQSGSWSRVYRFKPSLAANYRFNEVLALSMDSMGLVRGEIGVPFMAGFRVYPRVFSVALDALQYLEGQGILGAGEQVSLTKGRGYEYADSREYVEGDDLRQIDWKATARLGRMIVKEYYTEGSGAIHIVYDTRVSDPVSGDVLAAEYLRAVLSFAERGWVIGLTVYDGEVVVDHFPELYPGFAVSVALRHVLDSRRAELSSFFDVIDPGYNARLRQVLGSRLPRSEVEFDVLKDEMYGHKYGGVLYLSCLVGNPSGLMELSYIARLSRTRFVALEPCSPWRYTDLENGYRVLGQYDKVNRSLLRDGTPIAVDLVEAQEKLGELEPVVL